MSLEDAASAVGEARGRFDDLGAALAALQQYIRSVVLHDND